MPASLRTLALLAPLALLAACGGSPRAEAAQAKAPLAAAAPSPRPDGATPALRSSPAAAKSPGGAGKLAEPDCDPAKDSAASSTAAGGPMSRLRAVMAGDARVGAAGGQAPRCEPNEKKAATSPRGAGS